MDKQELKALKEFVFLLQKKKDEVQNFDFSLEKEKWLDKWGREDGSTQKKNESRRRQKEVLNLVF